MFKKNATAFFGAGELLLIAPRWWQWNDTKHRACPHCSPNNSDDKEEEGDDVNDEEGGEMGTTGLVFGHDESEDESDD